MADQQTSTEVKTIIVPKALEEFFAHRLEARYAAARRRAGDRRPAPGRAPHGSGPDPSPTAAAADRRVLAGWWSLPDMPFETS